MRKMLYLYESNIKLMKTLFLLPLIILSNFAFSQVIEEMPTDEAGKILFTEVVEVPNTDKTELYLRAKEFFVEAFKSANDVIQLDDKESAVLIGKGFSDINLKGGFGVPIVMKMYYTIKVQSKDSRYKYEIYDILYKSYGTYQYPETTIYSEGMFAKENYYKNNGKERTVNSNYKEATLNRINEIETSLKNKMKEDGISSSNDDW